MGQFPPCPSPLPFLPGPPFLSFPGGPGRSTASDVVGGGGGEVVVVVVGTDVLVVAGRGVGAGESVKIRMPARSRASTAATPINARRRLGRFRRGGGIGAKVAAGGGGEVSTIVGGRAAVAG